MTMSDVKIVTVREIQMLARSYIGPYDQTAKRLDEMYQWIMRKGFAIAGPGIGLYYDDPTKVDPVKCRSEICFPVLETCDGQGNVIRKVLPPHEMAAMSHEGGFGNIMSLTYATLFTWIGQNGYVYEAGEPIREIYSTCHLDVTVESDMITEVQIPVRKA